MNKKKSKKNKKKNKKNKKRTPAPPGNVRPNPFVPRAPKGTHAGEGSLATRKCHCLSLIPSIYAEHPKNIILNYCYAVFPQKL